MKRFLHCLIWLLSRISVLLLIFLTDHSTLRPERELIALRALPVISERFMPRGILTRPPLFFVAAWKLSSSDRAFGGFSALATTGGGFLALTDNGVFARFAVPANGGTRTGSLWMTPTGCGIGVSKVSRDTESLAIDWAGKSGWIGFEARNQLCRVDLRSNRALQVITPRAMRGWPTTGGLESLARLDDGKYFAIAERPFGAGPVSPALLFDRDPGAAGARLMRRRYVPPEGYRPDDAVQLPDGRLLVLNRRFGLPFTLPGRLSLVEKDSWLSGKPIAGRTIAHFERPDLDQNFEGLAVTRTRDRTFVWVISDDNFMPLQQTTLLLLEYRPDKG